MIPLPEARIHQVGNQMIHLVREKLDDSEEYLGLIEGGGICLANSFSTAEEADSWLCSMFTRLYTGHRCGFGCISLPGSKFLAAESELTRLMRLEQPSRPANG
jgi:hypothetical protein